MDDFDIPITSILSHLKKPSEASKNPFAKIDAYRALLTEAGHESLDKTYPTTIPTAANGRKRRGKSMEVLDEFGRTPTQIRRERNELNAQVHKDLLKDAYEHYSPSKGWRSVAHVTVIQHQHCDSCGGRVDSIAAELTRVTHPKYNNSLTCDIQRVHEVCDQELDLLPTIITEGNVRVENCASCITLRNLVTAPPVDLNAIGMSPYRQLSLLQ